MKFLFVDDNADLLRSLAGAFRKDPQVAFAECHSTDEALQAITEHKPDVIFLDHHLTDYGNEGLEIVDRIAGIKIYSTTSNTSVIPEYRKRGIQSVRKNDLQELRTLIAKLSANGNH